MYIKGKETITEVPTHTIHYGHIMDGEETVDEVLVMVMRGHCTFTGEDTVEINCHGGTYVVSRVLETVLKRREQDRQSRENLPRGHSKRQDGSVTGRGGHRCTYIRKMSMHCRVRSASSRKCGTGSKRSVRRLFIIQRFIETALDDPEHISVDGYGEVLKEAAEEVIDQLKELIDSSDDGRIMKEGIQTVILGKPNAGKVIPFEYSGGS